MLDTTNTEIPAELADECATLAESYDGVKVTRGESDLPGFDYFELYGVTDTSGCCDGEHDPDERRIGGRLVLTATGGCQVELDEQETADVMWALANATGRNRRSKRAVAAGDESERNLERAGRFDRQVALLAKITDSPA